MKKHLLLLIALGTTVPALAQTTRVGIGTTTPRAGLDVTHNDGFVATGEGPDYFSDGSTGAPFSPPRTRC